MQNDTQEMAHEQLKVSSNITLKFSTQTLKLLSKLLGLEFYLGSMEVPKGSDLGLQDHKN